MHGGNSWCAMKILVLSDSHSVIGFMRECVDTLKPDAVLHLGDCYADAQALAREYPTLAFYCVAGNCDRYRVCADDVPETLALRLGGVPIFLSHGHRQQVKYDTCIFAQEAQRCGAKLALFGHTHSPLCIPTEQGMWLMNPGTCGGSRPTAGLVTIENGAVADCRILDRTALEAFL